MLCDICNKNDALIHRITVINGKGLSSIYVPNAPGLRA